jgi:predicted ATP-grasp superfamily ATP-dependent carboligase
MSHKNRTDIPPVFILEMVDHGYAIARELSVYGIRIVGFLPQVKCLESHSHIPYKTYRIPENDEDLLKLLVDAKKKFGAVKPVLFLTGENYFPFIYKYLEQLQSIFAFEMPSYPRLKQMLEKDLFNLFAREHKVKIPVSIEVMKGRDLSLEMFDGLQFPLVIKPKHRDKEWKRKYKTQKAVLVSSPEEALSTCQAIFSTAERLVMQEWVPGPDANIHFCLTYITTNGIFLASACGIKYHQYPALFGNTSAAIPIHNPYVVEETHRILKEANIIGFCSVEFKKHAITGEFYVIEPTVGRMNRQELFSMPGKENVVLKAYCHLAGIPELPQKRIRENYIYVEENMDVKSCLDYHHYKTMNWKKYFKILRSRKIIPMYMSFKDPVLSLLVLGASIKHVVYYIFNGQTKYFSQEGAIDELIKENQKNYS